MFPVAIAATGEKRVPLTCADDNVGALLMQDDNELPMKIVGRRGPRPGGLEHANRFLHLVINLRGDRPFVPRGVYRFHSHEEKDEWTLRMLTRSKNSEKGRS